MTQHVAMKVNPQKLVESLKYSFTNKTTVFSELMQNARRAGASSVKFDYKPDTNTLVITDDGCGIESMATLLTVAESGWDTTLVEQEHPFGIGFLSALFACWHIIVASKGGQIDANTDDILGFKAIPVTACEWKGVTRITLIGVEFHEEYILNALKRLARGFPILVYFNGECLERPVAEDSSLDFVDTEIGKVYLHGLDKPFGGNSEVEVYLQGLPIYRSHCYSADRHVIHLDSSCFDARLPDRDKLIDEEETIERIKDVLRQEIEKRLQSMKLILTAEEFTGFYQLMRACRLVHLLNDVQVVPWEVLKEVIDYPVCSDEFGDFMDYPSKPVTREEIEARGVVAINDDIQEDGAGRYMFAWKKGHLLYSRRNYLDSGHWLHSLVDDLQTKNMQIEPVNVTSQYIFDGHWSSLKMRFCDFYRVHLNGEAIEIQDNAVYLGRDNGCEAIIPKQDVSGFVLKQVDRYENEHDNFQGASHEADVEALSRFCIANTTEDSAGALAKLLPDFAAYPALHGRSYIFEIDQSGKVAKVESA